MAADFVKGLVDGRTRARSGTVFNWQRRFGKPLAGGAETENYALGLDEFAAASGDENRHASIVEKVWRNGPVIATVSVRRAVSPSISSRLIGLPQPPY